MLWLYTGWLAQVTPGGSGQPIAPPPVDPGNDPLVTLIATVIFILVSVGGGVLIFKYRNRGRLS